MTAYLNYLENLAVKLGLQTLPNAERNALLEDLDMMVFRSVLFRAISALNKQDREDLHLLLDGTDDGSLRLPYEFLRKRVKNFDQIVQEEVKKTEKDVARVMKYFEA